VVGDFKNYRNTQWVKLKKCSIKTTSQDVEMSSSVILFLKTLRFSLLNDFLYKFTIFLYLSYRDALCKLPHFDRLDIIFILFYLHIILHYVKTTVLLHSKTIQMRKG